MPERGKRVHVPPVGRAILRVVESFTSPLQPDEYIELINPLWSTRELRGRIQRVKEETCDATTVFIMPGFRWTGHTPGQYVRIGIDIEGKRHWRAYSLSSPDTRSDGQVTITVKRVETGAVSSFITRRSATGAIVTLGEVEGEFTLPDPVPDKLLFVTAGSGVTPVMAMLRWLDRHEAMPDVVHLHSARTTDEAIFADELDDFAERHESYRVTHRATSIDGRILPEHLDELCQDWRDREAYVCGPGPMLDGMKEHYKGAELDERLHVESFEHMVTGDVVGEGGTVTLCKSELEAECDGSTPILEAGENAGATLPYGCRMGVCHTCVGMLNSGTVRDLRTGEVTKAGTEIRTCVNAAEGAVSLEL